MWSYLKSIIFIYIEKKKWRKSNLHNKTVMGQLFERNNVIVGNGTYGRLNIINYSECQKLRIGHFCSIGPDVLFVVCGEHNYRRISTYPFKTNFSKQKYEAYSKGDIIVEDDVWFGARSTILSGVSIGRGAVVTAGAMVVKDVPPYAIVGGVPAKIIKYRFSAEIIEELKKIDYSVFDSEKIVSNMNDLYREISENDNLAWIPEWMKKGNRDI